METSRIFVRRLKKLSPELADNFSTNCIVIRQMLYVYKKYFPYVEDFTMLRVLDVLEISKLLMDENVLTLTADEKCYSF